MLSYGELGEVTKDDSGKRACPSSHNSTLRIQNSLLAAGVVIQLPGREGQAKRICIDGTEEHRWCRGAGHGQDRHAKKKP